MNSIVITGRLGKKPEIKTAGNGTEYTNFTVAVNRFKKKDEEQITDWFNCSAFKQTAVYLNKYFDKGDGVVLFGRMECSKKDDKIYWTLVCERAEMGPKKNANGAAEDPVGDAPVSGFEPLQDEDIPF